LRYASSIATADWDTTQQISLATRTSRVQKGCRDRFAGPERRITFNGRDAPGRFTDTETYPQKNNSSSVSQSHSHSSCVTDTSQIQIQVPTSV
jgi:hypothetical protein